MRAKAADGEVRFFGDDAEPLDKAMEAAAAGLRIHLSPAAADMAGLRARLAACRPSERGGEVMLVAGLGEGREIEMKLPGRYRWTPPCAAR